MDSLITAAARALAMGDPLGALNRVALRDDAPALALRGIAMAQLGDLDRAKALVRRAARAFGPREAVARARCVVAEAEIALASRDLAWPAKALAAARGDPRSAWRPGERRPCALPRGAAPAPDRAPRRCRAQACASSISRRLRRRCAPSMSSRSPGFPCGVSAPRRRSAALARAEEAARWARIPALAAEVEQALAVLDTPAARLIARGGERPLLLEEVEALLASKALVIDACRNLVRERERAGAARKASGAVRACAHARRGVARGRAAGRAARPRVRREARRRIPSRAAAGRDRAAPRGCCGRSPA